RRRRRSWGAAPASACSTSTRMRIAPGGCSSSSVSARRRQRVSEVVAQTVDTLRGLGELKRVALVPALNEEHTVPRVVDELRAIDPGVEAVVGDEGPTDRRAGVAAARGARVLRLPFNLGIGGAVQTGFRFAFENGYDLVVRVDGDGQHDPSQLPRVLEPV